MKEQTIKTTRRLAATGFPLALLLALLIVWGAMAGGAALADDGAFSPENRLALYEIRVAESGTARLELTVPEGFEYVGLAAGSQVGAQPEVSAGGRLLVWQGPFAGAEVLRFWLASPDQAAAPETLALANESGQAVQVAPPATFAAPAQQPAPQAGQLEALAVTKTVDPDELNPGDSRWVTYEVVFTNDGGGLTTLDRVTDTLPSGFLFGGMAFGSDVITNPYAYEGSQYVWENLSFSDELTLRYNVRAVDTAGEYYNSVEAVSGVQTIGPAGAELEIVGPAMLKLFLPTAWNNYTTPLPAWEATKTSNVTEIEEGDLVDYTVTIANSGTYTGTIGSIADTLPDGFTYQQMLPGGDVLIPPAGVTGKIVWQGPWVLGPGDDLTLIYRVKSGGAGDKVNRVEAYDLAGSVVATASTTVYIGGGLPFYDDFSQGLSADWKPFVNFTGLSAASWYWAGTLGSWGIYVYDWDRVTPWNYGYALSVWDGPGAQTWTNYRVEAVVRDAKDTGSLKSGLTGVFFRGTVEDSGLMDGKSVRGYYVYIKPPDNTIYLMRTNGDNPSFAAADVIRSVNMYDKYKILIGRKHWYKLTIEVQGSNIKVWFDDDESTSDTPIRIFDVNDGLYDSGTVGFATYYTTAYYDYIRVTELP